MEEHKCYSCKILLIGTANQCERCGRFVCSEHSESDEDHNEKKFYICKKCLKEGYSLEGEYESSDYDSRKIIIKDKEQNVVSSFRYTNQ